MRSERFTVAEFAGDVFLLDETLGTSQRIGSHGRRLWGLLGSGATIDEAARTLAGETGGDLRIVLAETHRFVADLLVAGAIVPGST